MSLFFDFKINNNNQSEDLSLFDVQLKTPNFTKGHFPSKEILPAYTLAFMCSEFLSSQKGIKLKNYTIKSSKFSFPVEPSKSIQLSFSLIDEEKFNFVIFQNEKTCAKLSLITS